MHFNTYVQISFSHINLQLKTASLNHYIPDKRVKNSKFRILCF